MKRQDKLEILGTTPRQTWVICYPPAFSGPRNVGKGRRFQPNVLHFFRDFYSSFSQNIRIDSRRLNLVRVISTNTCLVGLCITYMYNSYICIKFTAWL